ncbi:ABC transporter permease [Pseudenhygromyxa sp. WMMC2535]|nr:ABC transporter permease [Pseudenhygromyxa sp. WMMC2535]
MLWNTLILALDAIWRNKVRSLLTMLGVVIGVASVIAMVQLGQAASLSVTQEIAEMGTNMLMVMPGVDRRGMSATPSAAEALTLADAKAMRAQIPGITVAPTASTSETVIRGSGSYSTTITGGSNELLEVRNLIIAQGRGFDDGEMAGAAVCILGKTIVDELYDVNGGDEPLGSTLRVGRAPCKVIGVLESKGQALGMDQDDVVLMPLTAVQRRLIGDDDVSMIYVSALEDGTSTQIKAEIEALMRKRRSVRADEEDDFNVRDMQELADALSGTTATLTALLGAIAAVSLLVGGIGIMNIMLVSVTERTREIGVRLAIGARGSEVLLQFLVEALVLSLLGGLLGVILGIIGTVIAVRQLGMPLVLSPEVTLLAFAVAASIGVVFGFVPARTAARLNPIDALRHE